MSIRRSHLILSRHPRPIKSPSPDIANRSMIVQTTPPLDQIRQFIITRQEIEECESPNESISLDGDFSRDKGGDFSRGGVHKCNYDSGISHDQIPSEHDNHCSKYSRLIELNEQLQTENTLLKGTNPQMKQQLLRNNILINSLVEQNKKLKRLLYTDGKLQYPTNSKSTRRDNGIDQSPQGLHQGILSIQGKLQHYEKQYQLHSIQKHELSVKMVEMEHRLRDYESKMFEFIPLKDENSRLKDENALLQQQLDEIDSLYERSLKDIELNLEQQRNKAIYFAEKYQQSLKKRPTVTPHCHETRQILHQTLELISQQHNSHLDTFQRRILSQESSIIFLEKQLVMTRNECQKLREIIDQYNTAPTKPTCNPNIQSNIELLLKKCQDHDNRDNHDNRGNRDTSTHAT